MVGGKREGRNELTSAKALLVLIKNGQSCSSENPMIMERISAGRQGILDGSETSDSPSEEEDHSEEGEEGRCRS